MLSDDIDWMDSVLEERFHQNGNTLSAWRRIKTALAELSTTPNGTRERAEIMEETRINKE